jgi:ubiquitin conjugation factor E4 B
VDHQRDDLVPYFLRDPEDDRGICLPFLAEMVSRVEEDDTVLPMLTRTMDMLSMRMAILDMSMDYKPYIQVSKGRRTLQG